MIHSQTSLAGLAKQTEKHQPHHSCQNEELGVSVCMRSTLLTSKLGFHIATGERNPLFYGFCHGLMWLLVEGLNFVTGTDCPQSHHRLESMTSSLARMPIPKFGRKGLGRVIFRLVEIISSSKLLTTVCSLWQQLPLNLPEVHQKWNVTQLVTKQSSSTRLLTDLSCNFPTTDIAPRRGCIPESAVTFPHKQGWSTVRYPSL